MSHDYHPAPPSADSDKLVAWVREAANEIENAHLTLDMFGFPRRSPDGLEMTMAARIARRLESPREQLASALYAAEVLERALRYMADYQMTGTEQTLHIDFQGKAREALRAIGRETAA